MPKFGPGTLTIGNESTEFDASCLVNSCTITSDNDTGDSRTMLCGTVRPGNITFTYTIGGNVDVDSDDAQGLFALSNDAKGQLLPFEFTPNNGGTSASGVLRITPLDFGGDEFGADLQSDFEWDIVGEPEYDYGTTAPDRYWEALVFKGDTPGPVYPTPLSPDSPSDGGSTSDSGSDSGSTSDSTSSSSSDSTSESVSDSESVFA